MSSNEVIDLTASSPPELPPGDTSASDKTKQPSSKRKRRFKASSIVNGTSEQSAAPRTSVEPPHPLPESKEATQPAVLQRAPPSKRKRDYADHGPELPVGSTEAARENPDRPGPLKRHKSDQNDEFRKSSTPPTPVTPVVDASATSETVKSQKKRRNRDSKARRPKDAKNQDTAGDEEDGELIDGGVDNPPTTNGSPITNNKTRKRPESSSGLVPKASGKKHKKKSESASRQKTVSDTESVKSCHMFFVDLDPSKDVVYENPEVKSKYRVEPGDLLLPDNVLLERPEEQQLSLSAVEVPPTDDTDTETEDDFQLIEDINGFQRYFDQPKLHQVEPCETCKQVHSSKICPGLVCHACGVIGQHTTNGCHQSIVCFRCGKRGHIARECDTPREMLRDWRCALCQSQRHNTSDCSLQWRTYVYRTPEERTAELERRRTLKVLILDNPTGEPIDTEAYISTDPYCYYCASKGHLGDHCPDPQRKQDCPEEPSSHNLDHLLRGSYGRWYRDMAPKLQRLAQPGQALFGDFIVDEEGMTGVGGGFQFNHGSADDVTPFAQPGRAGREKQMRRLVQQHDDEGDWFEDRQRDPGRPRQQQQQQRPPSRNIRVNYRDKYYDAPPPPSYAPVPLPPLPPPPMVAPPPIYFNGAPAGPRAGPPPRRYPSSHEISAGYRHAHVSEPRAGAPNRGSELSIRGAAQRRQEHGGNEHGSGGRHRGRESGRESGRDWEREDRRREWSRRDDHLARGQRSGYYNDRRRY